jgi:hypothetical protein
MKIIKVNREMYGVAFTDLGPLTDAHGDGNLYNIETDKPLTWIEPTTGTVMEYYSYAHFEFCGEEYLVLFETEQEYVDFEISSGFELY